MKLEQLGYEEEFWWWIKIGMVCATAIIGLGVCAWISHREAILRKVNGAYHWMFAKGELTDRVPVESTRERRLEILKQYYLAVLVEDGQDGTIFDCDILDAIESLEKKYKGQ